VLQIDGPLIDAASIAIISALRTARLPNVRGVVGESGKEEDFEVSGDMGECISIPYENVPLFLTVGKIGESLVLDPTASEIQCATSLVVVAVDRAGVCCGLQKCMGGSVTVEESAAATRMTAAAASSVFACLDAYYDREQIKASQFPEIPPPRIGLLY